MHFDLEPPMVAHDLRPHPWSDAARRNELHALCAWGNDHRTTLRPHGHLALKVVRAGHSLDRALKGADNVAEGRGVLSLELSWKAAGTTVSALKPGIPC